MGGSANSPVRSIIAAAWRRRHIIWSVILLSIPISLAVALMWPKTYSSNALLLLQEQVGINIGAQSYTDTGRMQQTVSGIDALLKSEFILSGVLHIVYDGVAVEHPKDTQALIEELRDRLTVEWVGDQFVRISLTGIEEVGLGAKLDAIIARLFESLLSPVSPTISAPGFLLRQRRDRVEMIEQRMSAFLIQAGDISAEEIGRKTQAIKDAHGKITALKAALEQGEVEVVRRLKEILGPGHESSDVEAEIEAREVKLSVLQENGQRESQEAKDLSETISKLKTLAPLHQTVASTRAALAAAQGNLFEEQNGLEAIRSKRGFRDGLRGQLQRARAQYRQILGRFKQNAAAISLLHTPAQVKIVDAPQDPTAPLNSRFLILIVGLGIGTVLSMALAFLCEAMDRSLRGHDDLVYLSELPVVAQFNKIPDFETLSVSLVTATDDEPPSHADPANQDSQRRVVGIVS